MTVGNSLSPAGWYRNPAGPGLRFFDVRQWTNRTRMPQRVRVVYRPPSHCFHAIMTAATCGMWAPVWAWSAGGRYKVRH